MVLRRVGVRTAWLLASLLLASLLIFAATNALPGDIAQVMLGTNASPGEAEALRERLGLNRPFLVRYFEWLWGAVRFDFGESFFSAGRSVTNLIAARLRGVAVAGGPRHAVRPADRVAGRRVLGDAASAPRRGRGVGAVPGRPRDPGLLGRHLARHHLRGATALAAGRGYVSYWDGSTGGPPTSCCPWPRWPWCRRR